MRRVFADEFSVQLQINARCLIAFTAVKRFLCLHVQLLTVHASKKSSVICFLFFNTFETLCRYVRVVVVETESGNETRVFHWRTSSFSALEEAQTYVCVRSRHNHLAEHKSLAMFRQMGKFYVLFSLMPFCGNMCLETGRHDVFGWACFMNTRPLAFKTQSHTQYPVIYEYELLQGIRTFLSKGHISYCTPIRGSEILCNAIALGCVTFCQISKFFINTVHCFFISDKMSLRQDEMASRTGFGPQAVGCRCLSYLKLCPSLLVTICCSIRVRQELCQWTLAKQAQQVTSAIFQALSACNILQMNRYKPSTSTWTGISQTPLPTYVWFCQTRVMVLNLW